MITMEICWIVNREETLDVRDNRATLEITTSFLSEDASLSAQISNLAYIKWNTLIRNLYNTKLLWAKVLNFECKNRTHNDANSYRIAGGLIA